MLELNNYYIQEVKNLTDLFTIIFTIVDDIYNDIIPISIRNRRNIKDSKLSDSEIITISIVGELLTIDSEKAFFSLLSREYTRLFPKLGDRTRFNRTKRNLHAVIKEIREYISLSIQSYSNEIRVIDSMPIPVCEFGRAHFSKCFKGEASYGRCPSKKQIYFGFKFHALTTVDGFLTDYVIMPGYTHLQRAQVVTFKHHLMAYYSMFTRDEKRLINALEILDESPLGCGALAGTTHNIDRNITKEKLGFKRVVENYMDGVSDRDYLIELMSDFSIIMMHLSRLSEELILWSSQEFKFVEIDDLYTTGSSIMPQKKNPDGAELIRGKTGRVYGNLMGLLTVMKGLPLAYNKDMQEDKEGFFDSVKQLKMCIQVMEKMIATLKVNKEQMKSCVKSGFLNATEVADYLVKKGIPFRNAHSIVGAIVIYCEDNKKSIEELSLNELSQFADVFDEGIYDFIDYDKILDKGIKELIK